MTFIKYNQNGEFDILSISLYLKLKYKLFGRMEIELWEVKLLRKKN
jgi:hypothetical protein